MGFWDFLSRNKRHDEDVEQNFLGDGGVQALQGICPDLVIGEQRLAADEERFVSGESCACAHGRMKTSEDQKEHHIMEKVRWSVSAMVLAAAMLMAPAAEARLRVGYRVKSIKVKDASDNPAWIPDIGKKVITLFYTDPDVKDQNERFREMLKAEKLPKKKYRGMGVVNMKDTWKPNFAIRRVVRKKVAKFKSLILTDPDHSLKNQWALGDCNEKDVVIVIGRDKKVKYLKMGPMSQGERQKTLKLVKELVAKAP